ncbi:peptide-methionine (S)-S-oxide reductase MsrA [Fulvivirga sedimenti]|uniref:Peptide methionine sulfoxide reductase MsrA n=1 Tax=Fulvivirga sedimenti TaxID=2879465 RepID=A0A9X1HVY0_9BACT|nr:peptide-methionine (S)-S-oxide reductase MsrA [Fulvivirga sedimenti]MCA6079228.1 peptide-methionine (S)-S-oxide reductase MsrA [Fulvivirga sedimenti]
MKSANHLYSILLLIFLAWSCQAKETRQEYANPTPVLTAAQQERLDTVYFASGCFWCTEAVFERVQGVYDVVSGYSGGDKKNPTYEQVGAGLTNYAEAVRVVYDSDQISYVELLEIFFASHDPTTLNRQGPDVGKQYRSAIFYRTDSEKSLATTMKEKLNKSGKYRNPIVTEITRFKSFYEAEDYHQNYYEIHPENPYVQSVSKPKVEKFMKEFKEKLKPEFQ